MDTKKSRGIFPLKLLNQIFTYSTQHADEEF